MMHLGTRNRGRLVAVGLAALFLAAAAPARAAEPPSVIVLPTTGTVDGVMAGYLSDEIARAANDGAAAVVVELDTFGGSLDATAQITETLLEAPVPVIVWVAPAGARAASAGTFITLAAHLSYMAPGTNIGAASPVGANGADIPGTLGEKVRNDAIAKITAIAQARGRPVDWAVTTVESARSYSAEEAVAAGAIDGIAATLDEVLASANGKTVTVAGTPRVLDLTGAVTTERAMNPVSLVLHETSEPTIAFLLFVLGVLGIGFEFFAPNFITGILGAIAIVLSFVGFGSLPLNIAGLVIIAIGVGLLLLEAHVPSHGLLTLGAVACIVLGASVLYSAPGGPTAPDASVAWPVVGLIVAGMAAFGAVVAVAAVRSRRMSGGPELVGTLSVVGLTGKVTHPIDPLGTVHAAGEEWSARSVGGIPIPRGTRVTIVRKDGLVLFVEPAAEGAPPGIESAPTQPVTSPNRAG